MSFNFQRLCSHSCNHSRSNVKRAKKNKACLCLQKKWQISFQYFPYFNKLKPRLSSLVVCNYSHTYLPTIQLLQLLMIYFNIWTQRTSILCTGRVILLFLLFLCISLGEDIAPYSNINMHWDHLEDEYHYLQFTIWMFDEGVYRKENSFPCVKLENTVWDPSIKCLCVLLKEGFPKLNKKE